MPLRNWLGILILCLVISLPFFAHLEASFPILLWDEGRLANSAIEMYETGNLIVITYDYEPEMWSTKPPLLIWLQAISLHLFGIRDLSFRLPVSFAGIFTCIFLYFFCRRKLNAPWLGIIAAAILVSTPGYIRIHGLRTGDYDGVLALFTTISLLCFYLFIQNGSKKQFWISVAALILACLTKGIAGLMFVPAMLLYTVFRRKLLPLIRSRELYMGLVAFVVFVPGYYLLRETYNSGYMSAMWENEANRFAVEKEGHGQPFDFYYHNFVDFAFKPFLVLFILGVITAFVAKYNTFRSISQYLLLCSVTFVLIISGSTTKHSWYLLPIFPLLSIVCAVPVYIICQRLYDSEWWKQYLRVNILPYLFLGFIFTGPLTDSVDAATKNKGYGGWLQGAEDMGRVFQDMLKKGYRYDHKMKAMFDDFQAPMKWYMKAFRLKNIPVTELKNEKELIKEDLLIVYSDSLKAHVENNYKTHIVEKLGQATIYQVHGTK